MRMVFTANKRLLRVASVPTRCRLKLFHLSFSNSSPVSFPRTNQAAIPLCSTPLPSGRYFSLYNYLYAKLKSPPSLFEARRLHALLVVNGFFQAVHDDRVLGSQLVNVYVSYGCFDEALIVFNELPRKGKLAWNALLRGFVQRDQFSEAIQFYELMLKNGADPDNFTYPLVLKACSGLKDLKRGRKIRDLILFDKSNHKLKLNLHVQCALVDMFAKSGSFVEARQLFDEMLVKDLASWGAIISGGVHNGRWSEAFALFRSMKSEGMRPDAVILATLLPVCGRLEEVKELGPALHCYAICSGYDSDVFVSNAIIDSYGKRGDMNAAHAVFRSMVYKDTVSWSSLIAGFAQNWLHQESLQLYLEMKKSGIRTNGIIIASILPGLGKLKLLKQGKQVHDFVQKQGIECDVVVWSALIEMYSHCGSLMEAEHIFKLVSDHDISLWNSMISGYSLNDDVDMAINTFQRIWRSSCRPNSITLLTILSICNRMGNLQLGKQIHCYAIRTALEKVIPVMNSIIDTYWKCGYLQLGMSVFNQMTEKNIVSYNTVISAHGAYGLGETALLFFDQMKKLGIKPNRVTFLALLSACSHAGLISRGQSIYHCMINEHSMLPGMEHYACMVDLFGRAGLLEDACHFIQNMHLEPDINVIGSLLGACRLQKHVQLAEMLGRKMLQQGLSDSGCYILLSNIYASVEKWDDASGFRTLIKEKGLSKNPGSSLIQLGAIVHKCQAGDEVPPGVNTIKNILLMEMKNEGNTGDQNQIPN